MSASEKLKALRLQPVVYADGDFKFRDGFSEESLRPLLYALPQIVAVVEAVEIAAGKQQEALEIIRANGFVFEDIGKEPGNWQHLAFTLYTELCEIDAYSSPALRELEEALS